MASYDYADPGLRRLRAPAHDAEALAGVLGDPEIGGFQVETVLNQPAYDVNLAVEKFFANRNVDDLLLLHYSGHGVKDEDGDLYFAAANTNLQLLGSTAVSSDFVNRLMGRTRARRVVLLLDCCYAGAFERGLSTRSDTSLHLEERLGGRGRAVITASTAMEYAFEGGDVTDTSAAQPSVFTSALVEGLRTGDADTDQDGLIGLHELYDYVYDKVRTVTPHQTPSKWELGLQGELYIARRSRPVTTPAALPDGLQEALESPFVGVRAGAVHELGQLLRGRHAGLALAARQALEQLASDDSRSVATAAADTLRDAPEETTAADAPRRPDKVATIENQPAKTAPAEPPAPAPAAAPVPAERRHSRLGRRGTLLLVSVATAALVAGTALTLSMSDDSASTPPNPSPTPTQSPTESTPEPLATANEIVLPLRIEADGDRDRAKLHRVDSANGEILGQLLPDTAMLPTISPDRTTIIFLDSPNVESPRVPWVYTSDDPKPTRLFEEGSRCQHTTRPAWRPDGKQLAVICTDDNTLNLADPDGTRLEQLDVGGTPTGSPTWWTVAGREVVVYERELTNECTALWAIDPRRADETELTTGVSGCDSHADGDERGLLFVRTPPEAASRNTGDAWVLEVPDIRDDISEPVQLIELTDLADPAWSPDGKSIAFVQDKQLCIAQFPAVGPDCFSFTEPKARPGPPAWGSR